MPLEKVHYLSNTTHQRTQFFEIQSHFDDEGFDVIKKLEVKINLHINIDQEVQPKETDESLLWWLYNREKQCAYLATKTADGEPLSQEDIVYLLARLLPQTKDIDKFNALLHDKIWAKVIASSWVGLDSYYLANHTLPEINKAWALQALSYIIENGQLVTLQKLIPLDPIGKNMDFLSQKFIELLNESDVILKRIAAVALSYLLPEKDASNQSRQVMDRIFSVLLEMLRLIPILQDDTLDNGFKVEKEMNVLGVRLRATTALKLLAKKKYAIPENIFRFSLSLIESLEKAQTIYLGRCSARTVEAIKGGGSYWQRMSTYETEALNKRPFTQGEFSYIYQYIIDKGNLSCLKALFYAGTVNAQKLPEGTGGTTLNKVLDKCSALIKTKHNNCEEAFIAACFLSSHSTVSQSMFEEAVTELLERMNVSEDRESGIHGHCSIALSYALHRHAEWMQKYTTEVNARFDPLRVEVLRFLIYTISNSNHSDLMGLEETKVRLQLLTRNANRELSWMAYECLKHLSSKQPTHYDDAFKTNLEKELKSTDKERQKKAIEMCEIMVIGQEVNAENNISLALLNVLCERLNDDLPKIVFILTKLFQNSLYLKVPIPGDVFPSECIEKLIRIMCHEEKDATASLLLRLIAENIEQKTELLPNFDCIVQYLNPITQVLYSPAHDESIKKHILKLIYDVVLYKQDHFTASVIQFFELMNNLTQVLKTRQLVFGTLRILGLLTLHSEHHPFSDSLFVELIAVLQEGEPAIVKGIHTLFQMYIRQRSTEKLPITCINRLGLLLNSGGFVHVKPILYYLVIDQKEAIPADAILPFFEAISGDDEEIALFCSELLYHSASSINQTLLSEIKAVLIDIHDKGMLKTAVILLKTLFQVIMSQEGFSNILDESLENTIVKMNEQAVLSSHDRQGIYDYLAHYSIKIPISLVEEAIKDVQSSEVAALSAIGFLERILFNLQNSLLEDKQMIQESIMRCFAQSLCRSNLTHVLLETIASILRINAEYNHRDIIHFCLSLQYESENENKILALEIIGYAKDSVLEDGELKESIKRIYVRETQAKALKQNYNGAFVNVIHQDAVEGKRISTSALNYLVACYHDKSRTDNSFVLATLVLIAKNGQSVLHQLNAILVEILRNHFFNDVSKISLVIELVYHSMNHDCVLEDDLFEAIQVKFKITGNPLLKNFLEIIKKQTIRGKSLQAKVVKKLTRLIHEHQDATEKSLAIFILSFHVEKGYVLGEQEHEVKKELLRLMIHSDSKFHQKNVDLLRKLFPELYEKLSSYIAFKENSILLLQGSSNKRALLVGIKNSLTEITCLKTDNRPFYNRLDFKKDIIEKVNAIVLNVLNSDNQIENSVLSLLIQCMKLYPDYVPSVAIVQKLYLYILADSNEETFDFLLNLIDLPQIGDAQMTEEYINILKYLIRTSTVAETRQKALVLFKLTFKEYPSHLSNDQLIDWIRHHEALSPKAQWLNEKLEIASGNKISIVHEYYRKKMHFIVSTAEQIDFELNHLEPFLKQDPAFSQNDFFSLVKLFELLAEINASEDIAEYRWKIHFLIHDFVKTNEQDITWLLRSCESCYILGQLGNLDTREHTRDVVDPILALLAQDWQRDSIIQMGKNLLLSEPYDFFQALVRYKIPANKSREMLDLTQQRYEHHAQLMKALHRFFIGLHFSTDIREKEVPELMDDFFSDNAIDTSELRSCIETIRNETSYNKVFEAISPKSVKHWEEHEFQAWAAKIAEYNLTEQLIVINQAVKLYTERQARLENEHTPSFGLRASQLLVILYILKHKFNLLGQLLTGEGKAIIIAVLALIKTLLGRTVDIGVSSPLLAERDSDKFKTFFALFKITVSHNNNSIEQNDIKGVRPCYNAQIVYGEISQFQFDLLKDTFKQQGTKGNRKSDIILVDEADNVVLDQAENIAKLAEQIPGFDHLEFLYILIWARLQRELNGYEILLRAPELTQKSPNMMAETLYLYCNERDEVMCSIKLPLPDGKDFRHYINIPFETESSEEKKALIKIIKEKIQQGEVSISGPENVLLKNAILVYVLEDEDYEQAKAFTKTEELAELKKRIVTYIQHVMNNPEYVGENIRFPLHLKDYIHSQIPHWIDSAVHVFFNLEENRDYIISSNDHGVRYIAPVDYANTGVTLLNTQWSNGIHQFLQLKEGLQLTPETLTTNYLSNYAFLKRYNQLLGLTGTLGNKKTQDLLSRVYRNKAEKALKCVLFPSHKRKQFFLYQEVIANDQSLWLEQIKKSVDRELSVDRAVIIICETIQEVKRIKKALNPQCKLRELKRSDLDVLDVDSTLFDSEQILLATTLGGRGLDPKPSPQVISQGGPHVIVGSLLSNQRAFEQAIGRTARNGNPGTAELIVNIANLVYAFPIQPSLALLDAYRDYLEEQKFAVLERNLLMIDLQDDLFKLFCDLLKAITTKIDNRLNTPRSYVDFAYYELFLYDKEAKVAALIERWGLWLKQADFSLDKSAILSAFSVFKEEIEANYEADLRKSNTESTLIKNPCYLLQQNNHILTYLNSWKHALSQFGTYRQDAHDSIMQNCAQVHDPLFQSQTYAIQGYARLTNGESNGQASESFKQALVFLQNNNFPQLLLQQHWLKQVDPKTLARESTVVCDFSNQISEKIAMISAIARNYEKAVEDINRARKLVDIRVGKHAHVQLSKEECLKKIKEASKKFVDVSAPKKIRLRFHDLRMVYDVKRLVRDEPTTLVNTLYEQRLVRQECNPHVLFEACRPEFYGDLLRKFCEQTDERIQHLKITFYTNTPFSQFDARDKGRLKLLLERKKEKDIKRLGKKLHQELLEILEQGGDLSKKILSHAEIDCLNYFLDKSNPSLREKVDVALKMSEIFATPDAIHSILDNNLSNIASMAIAIENQERIIQFFHLFYLEISEAMIVVNDLDFAQTNGLLEALHFTEESFHKTHLRAIDTVFSNPKQRHDIAQFMSNGFCFLFELREKQPLQVYTMVIMGTVAVAEIATGSLLVVFSGVSIFGLGVGIGLICDGITDGFDIIRVGITREHNWLHYGIQKTVSMGLIVATAGISSAMAVSSAKVKSGVSVTRKSTNIAVTKGTTAEISDDTVNRLVITKVCSKTIAHRATVVVHHEVAKAVVKTAVSQTVSLAVDHMSMILTPKVYAAFEQKIIRGVEKVVNRILLKENIKIRHILACAEYLGITQFDYRFKRELMDIVKKHLSKKFASIGGIVKSIQLLQETFLYEAINETATSVLLHIEEQSKKMGLKQVLYHFFEDKHLDFETASKNTESVMSILANTGIISGAFYHLHDNFPEDAMDWTQFPHVSSYGEEITVLYQQLHSLIYQESSTDPMHKTVSLGVKKLSDIMHNVMTNAALEEVVKGINWVELGIKAGIKLVPGVLISPSELYSPRSLIDPETWHHLEQTIDPRRYLSFMLEGAANYLLSFLNETLNTNQAEHWHELWVQNANSARISIHRAQRLNEDGMQENVSIDLQFLSMAAPEQEQLMRQILGLSFADKNQQLLNSWRYFSTDGLRLLFEFLDMEDEQLHSLENSMHLFKIIDSIAIFYRIIKTVIVIATELSWDLAQAPWNLWKYVTELSTIALSDNAIQLLALLKSDEFWTSLSIYADRLPLIPEQIRRKLDVCRDVFSMLPTRMTGKLCDVLSETSAYCIDNNVTEFLTLSCDLIQAHNAIPLLRNLLDYQRNQTMKLYVLLDLLSVPIDNGETLLASRISLILSQKMSTLYRYVRENYQPLLDSHTKEITSFENYNALLQFVGLSEKEENVVSLFQIVLSLLDPRESCNQYTNLRNLIPYYGHDKNALMSIMLVQLCYENPLVHNNLKNNSAFLNVIKHLLLTQSSVSFYPADMVIPDIVYRELFYDLKLMLTAYHEPNKRLGTLIKPICDLIGSALRIADHLTNHWSKLFVALFVGCFYVFERSCLQKLVLSTAVLFALEMMGALAYPEGLRRVNRQNSFLYSVKDGMQKLNAYVFHEHRQADEEIPENDLDFSPSIVNAT